MDSIRLSAQHKLPTTGGTYVSNNDIVYMYNPHPHLPLTEHELNGQGHPSVKPRTGDAHNYGDGGE